MSLQKHYYQWNAKPLNEGKHYSKNVNVELDVKAQRSRKLYCKTKIGNNKEFVRKKNLRARLKKKKKKNHLQEKKASVLISSQQV